jgi:phosphate-selective porin OprO and OprP
MIKSSWVAMPLMAAIFMLWAGQARAQSNQELQREVEELKREVQTLEQQNEKLLELDQKVDVIGRKLEIQNDAEREASRTKPVVDASSKGFFLKSADDGKTFKLRIGGWLQADSRWYLSQTKPTGSEFLIRRLRPYLQGTVEEYYDFQFLVDFGQGQTILQDAFTDIHYWPEFRLRAGKFKSPFGLERLVDDRYLKFVERSLASNLVPDREIGFDFHGDLLDQSPSACSTARRTTRRRSTATTTTPRTSRRACTRILFGIPSTKLRGSWL